jgi:Mrp family chromosome partitioning ATPase/capsular polysaccharide biosynthesis protein
MQQDTDTLRLGEALRIVLRRAPLVILCMVVVGAAAFAYSRSQEKEYKATAALEFGSSNAFAQHVLGLEPTGTSGQLAQHATNEQIVALGDSAARTAEKLGTTEGKVRKSISVSGQGESNIVDVTAESTSPQAAAKIANTYASLFVAGQSQLNSHSFHEALKLVERQIDSLPPGRRYSTVAESLQNRAQTLRLLQGIDYGGVKVVAKARPSSTPSSPNTKKNVAIGVMVGLLIGLGLAFLVERLQRRSRLRDRPELEAAYGLQVLGAIPENPGLAIGDKGAKARAAGEAEPALEAFRMLRARLLLAATERPLQVVLVAGAAPGEGATTVAKGLAEAEARAGSEVLVIDADLRQPSLSAELGLAWEPGLSDVLSGGVATADAIRIAELENGGEPTPGPRMHVLSCGTASAQLRDALFEGPAMAEVMRYARSYYRLVVIDAPPLVTSADGLSLLGKVDGVLVVSRLDGSRRELAEQLRQLLDIGHAPQLGVVANGVKAKLKGPGSIGTTTWSPTAGDGTPTPPSVGQAG